MNKTVVCIAYKGDRGYQHDDAVDVLKYELRVPVLKMVGCMYIGKARSHLATVALADGADVVFFIDSDSIFDPVDVERVANVARDTRGIVGVPYSQRRVGGLIVGSFAESVTEVTFFEGGGTYPASGVIGMGFTAIHRDVFSKFDELPDMAPLRWSGGECRPYFREITVDGSWLHEDASFCREARRLGSRTDLDTRFRVLHLGEHPFRIEDCMASPDQARSALLQINRAVGK